MCRGQNHKTCMMVARTLTHQTPPSGGALLSDENLIARERYLL